MKNIYNPDGRLWTALLAVAALSVNTMQAVPHAPLPKERTQLTQQQETVMGRVNDASTNEPISGVTITVKGTNVSTQTDENGQFTIQARSGQTLVASFLGYRTGEMRISSSTVNFSLDTEGEDMEEVVVVGYGTMRKSDVTGSISVAKGADMIKNQNFSAIDNLRGQAAGVNVYSNSSQPGAYANRVVIRGAASILSSSNPLYVVDGVVMENFHLVNPNDIERMEVLKDASSAAIYGARGANGVVLVTTKRGTKDGRRTLSYQGSTSVSSPQRYMDVLNAEEWVQAFMIGLENENKWQDEALKRRNSNWVPWSLDRKDWFNDPNYFDANGNPLYDTDWQREATRTAISQNHQLNIQQGDENSSVGAFINYTDQQGIVNNTYNKRLNGKLAYDTKVKEWLSSSINLTANHTFGRFTPEDGGGQEARRTMIEMLPWLPVNQPDGQYTFSGSSTVNNRLGFEGMSNPVSILDLQERRRANTQIFGNAALTFHLADGLDLKTQYGIDKQRREYRGYSSVLLHNISRPNGWAQIENEDIFYWQQETYLSYNKQFDNHRINAVAGLSWQGRERNLSLNRTEGFKDDFFKWNNMAAGTLPAAPQSAYDRWGMNSYFMRAAYTLNDKYSATVTGRYDGSSRFGANNKFGFFPSMGLAWVASNEDFLRDVSWLSNLKLRSSLGITGNSELPAYQSIGRVISGTHLINTSRESFSYLGNLTNEELKWEKTTTIDGGFEMGLFQNRLNFDVSYYNRRTTDLLLEAPLPTSSGFGFVVQNIGAVNNRGLDIMISGSPVRNDNFQWTSTINMNYNKNEVVRLSNNNADIQRNNFVGGPNSIIRVGENLNSFYGFRRNGIFTVEDFENGLIAKEQIGRPNRTAGQEILGKGIPDWSGSFINTFNYKNFDMTVDMQIVYGVETLQQFYHSTYDRFGITNGLREILTDAYSPSNPNTMQQAIYLTNGGHAGQDTRIDSSWIVDGSFLRFNLIQLGYSFDPSWAQRLGISGLRLYASANNPWIIMSKDFKGYDPESTSTGDNNKFGQNVTFFSYPRAKTFTFGLNLTL